MRVKRLGVNGLMLTVLLLWSGIALAQDAQVYELTENMQLFVRGDVSRRIATSQIMGFALEGTPLCPAGLAQPIPGRANGRNVCTINVTGANRIDVKTGLGSLRGRFTVVVQDLNLADGPEFVVMRGTFRGDMDFSAALVQGVPFGTVKGAFSSEHGTTVPFTGTFLLPFVIPGDPSETVYYLDFDPANPAGVVPVQSNETTLGFATVRFDIKF